MASGNLRELWTGLIAAAHTPFDEQGRLRLEQVDRQAELLARLGVTGVFICGSTGEGASLSKEERQQMAVKWSKAGPAAGLKWVVHVGSNVLAESLELAAQAQALGADAISALPPSYFKPSGMEELVSFTPTVAAAAPNLPFFYYHIPGMTGVTVSAADYLDQATGRIPNLHGLKFSHGDMMELQESVQAKEGRYAILYGTDQALLPALSVGACGAVGSTYNYAAPLYLDVMKAFSKGDLEAARQLQYQAVRMVRTQWKYDVLISGKALMKFLGVDCGPVRPPLRNLSAKQCESLREELKAIPGLKKLFGG